MTTKTCPPCDYNCSQGDECPDRMAAMHRIPAPFEPVWYQHWIERQAKAAAPVQPVPCSTLVRWWLWFKRAF